MNAIAQVEPASLLNLVARAASDPGTDVAKMQALIEMQERILTRESRAEYMRAMARVAAALEPVRKDAVNPSFGKGYASLGAIDTAIRPIYTEHGFSVAYGTVDAPPGHIGVSCTVSHESGYSETLALHAPLDTQTGGRARTPVQAVGSTVSYLRRYLVSMAFNVATADDDDGEASRRAVSQAPPMRTRREPPTREPEPEEDAGGNGDAAAPEHQLWLGIHTKRLESEQDVGKWLVLYEDACATASNEADLVRLHGIDVVERAMAKAPEAVKRRMTKASGAAFARLTPPPAAANTGEITPADRLHA